MLKAGKYVGKKIRLEKGRMKSFYLNQMILVNLNKKVVTEKKLERDNGSRHMNIHGKNIPGRDNIQAGYVCQTVLEFNVRFFENIHH